MTWNIYDISFDQVGWAGGSNFQVRPEQLPRSGGQSERSHGERNAVATLFGDGDLDEAPFVPYKKKSMYMDKHQLASIEEQAKLGWGGTQLRGPKKTGNITSANADA
jgi:hypothetical protein